MYQGQINKHSHLIIFLFCAMIFMVVVFKVYAQTSSNRVITRVGDPQGPAPGGDGVHACPFQATYIPWPGFGNIHQNQFSFVCGHCRPIINANDLIVDQSGGLPEFAVTNGVVEDITNPVGGPALWLTGDDGQNYYYAHLKKEGHITGRVTAGQQIGFVAAGSEPYFTGNNSTAHLHISAGTPGNQQSFNNPANIPIGPLLDSWCGSNACNGQPNHDLNCPNT